MDEITTQRLSEAEFDALQAEWDALLDRSACRSVFLKWSWIHTWWTVFKPDADLYLLAHRRDGRLIGLAPFFLTHASWPNARTVKLCSSEDVSPDYLDVISDPGLSEAIIEATADYLIAHRSEWDLLDLDNVAPDSKLLTTLGALSSYPRESKVSQNCPYIQFPATFKEYYAAQAPKIGKFGLEKKLSKLRLQENGVHVRVNDEQSLSRALNYLFSLHSKRAAMKSMDSNFENDATKKFHHQLAHAFLKEGILDLQLLTAHEMPISAIYAFRYKNRVSVYQTGFDPEWKKYSVGGTLLYLTLEAAFAEGFDELDFLKGTESYKALWASGVREEFRILIYNRNSRGLICYALELLKAKLRPLKAKMVAPAHSAE